MFTVVYSDEHMIDSFECDTFERAKDEALDILANWQVSAVNDINDINNATQSEIDNYDCIIENGCVYIEKDGEEFWYPSPEDLKAVSWVPFEDYLKIIEN